MLTMNLPLYINYKMLVHIQYYVVFRNVKLSGHSNIQVIFKGVRFKKKFDFPRKGDSKS